MKNGWKRSGDEMGIKMTKNGNFLIFYIIVRTAIGLVYLLYLKHVAKELA